MSGYPDEVVRDAVWLAKLARGSSWPGEMAERVESAAERVIGAMGTDADRLALAWRNELEGYTPAEVLKDGDR